MGGIITRKVILITFSSIIFITILACFINKNVNFSIFYSQVIGFSENDEKYESIPTDTVLLITNEDFKKFKDKYFTSRELPIGSPSKGKAVLYLQIPSSSSDVDTYSVKSINIKNNILNVNLERLSMAIVDGKGGFVGTWKWVMFIEIDKSNLKDNMKIVVNK